MATKSSMSAVLGRMQELREASSRQISDARYKQLFISVLDVFLENDELLLSGERVQLLSAFYAGRNTRVTFDEFYSGYFNSTYQKKNNETQNQRTPDRTPDDRPEH